jgi:hypothetical protein
VLQFKVFIGELGTIDALATLKANKNGNLYKDLASHKSSFLQNHTSSISASEITTLAHLSKSEGKGSKLSRTCTIQALRHQHRKDTNPGIILWNLEPL